MDQREKDALLIFTADPLEDVLASSNSAAWKLNIKRASSAKYMILARNDPKRGVGHRAAFMVAKITGIVPRIEEGVEPDGRWAVTFDCYAEVHKKDAWEKANQFPVTYVCAAEVLDLDPEELRFKPAPPKILNWSYSRRVGRQPQAPEEGISVAEAKRRLSIRFGVPEANIDITIRA